MSRRSVLVLGGGVGGVVAATVLRRQLAPEDRVVLIERASTHVFWPSLLWLMTGTRRAGQIQRDFGALARRGIEVRHGEITGIDPQRRAVSVNGEELTGDALVVGLGASLAPERLPGLAEAGCSFYTLAGAERLYRELEGLERGRVAVVVADVPFKCPAAPYEGAMLIDHLLRKRKVRDHVEVSLYAAEPGPMGVAGQRVSAAVADAVSQRGIDYRPNEKLVSVDVQGRRLRFASGAEASFDVLAAVPPHVPPEVVRTSPLASPTGWIAIDPATCQTEFENVYAIGDATVVPLPLGKPLPKAGVFAHAQAEAVAHTLAARLRGRGQERRFDGHGECFVEMGGGVAGFARGDFYAQPAPQVRMFRPGRHWHASKVAFEKSWWHSWF